MKNDYLKLIKSIHEKKLKKKKGGGPKGKEKEKSKEKEKGKEDADKGKEDKQDKEGTDKGKEDKSKEGEENKEGKEDKSKEDKGKEGKEGEEGAEGAEGEEGAEAEKDISELSSSERRELALGEIDKLEKHQKKSASYPDKLQIIPTDAHMTKKLSDKFELHLKDLEKKIDDANEKIKKQAEYVEAEQEDLNKKKEILEHYEIDVKKESEEKAFTSIIKFWDTFCSMIVLAGTFIKNGLLILIGIIRAAKPFIQYILALIALLVVIGIILAIIFGKKAKKRTEEDEAVETTESSRDYGKSGTAEEWSWEKCIKNPIVYTLYYSAGNLNNQLDIQSKVRRLQLLNPLNTITRTLGIIDIEKFKSERPINIISETDSTHIQREDNISYINSSLINEDIINNNNLTSDIKKAIYILKPSDIKWEFPESEYIDIAKMPESIKKYKDLDKPNSMSLSETRNVIIPWERGQDSWSITCDNMKFENNKEANLYKDSTVGEERLCQPKDVSKERYEIQSVT
jgi:uncharacterized membrane protein